jgi:L-gulonate 3-dehydrogenase
MSAAQERHVAIVGAGSIGVAFSIVFARSHWAVKLFDPEQARREVAFGEITQRLEELARFSLIDEPANDIAARVEVTAWLEHAVQDAELVLECAPERVEVKRALFEQFDAAAPLDALFASASSAIPVSSYTADLPGRARCLVAHPGNPPYLLPVIEIVPAPFTSPDVTRRAQQLFRDAGMTPVLVAKEVEGFLFNRLQGAVLREAYCLVRDGVASVDDIDIVVREGLGMRWSVIGPFETVDLNTRGGIESHAQKMGPAYERMGAERGQCDPWTDDLVAKVAKSRRDALPLDRWGARVAWRDRALMALARHRKADASSES